MAAGLIRSRSRRLARDRYDLAPIARFKLCQQISPRLQGGLALLKVIMAVVDTLNTFDFMIQATLGNMRKLSKRFQVRARCTPEVVDGNSPRHTAPREKCQF